MPDLKPELSGRNKYWIPKHRYYELKHYCLQYPYWKELYLKLDGQIKAHQNIEVHTGFNESKVEKLGITRAELKQAMELVERTCHDAASELESYIFKAVTEGAPYVRLRTVYDIPCGQEYYYNYYRRFFYLLSQRRGI